MQVIDEGIFCGFIPINHHWVNDDPSIYYDISNSVNATPRVRNITKRSISQFNLEGYQVVRSQFMQVRYEGPCVTLANGHITFNLFSVRCFEKEAYIQLLLHPVERKIAIRPCRQYDTHSIKWRPNPEKSINIKTLCCQHFGNALFTIMSWNPDYIYCVRGTLVRRGADQIMIFNLLNGVPAALISQTDETSRKRRIELCPEEWADDFGEEFYEHTLENGFYYLAPKNEWKAQAESVPAPSITQYDLPDSTAFQMSIDDLTRGVPANNEQPVG